MPELHPAEGAFEDFKKTDAFKEARQAVLDGIAHGEYKNLDTALRHLFSIGWNAALAWVPIEISKIRELCELPTEKGYGKVTERVEFDTDGRTDS